MPYGFQVERTVKSTFSHLYAPALALCVGGCAGQVATQTGIAGKAIEANTTFAIVASPTEQEGTNSLAQAAVASALAQRGHAMAADAQLRVEVSVAERRAPIAVEDLAGKEVSPSRKRRFLQSCAQRIQRLTIAVYTDKQPGVTRVWAEERHCKAELQASITALSERAVALLVDPALPLQTKRLGLN